MRQRAVTQLVLALSTLFVIAAFAFAVRARAKVPAPTTRQDGAQLFAERCAACHTLADAAQRVDAARPSGAKTLEFLSTHTGATADENRAILRELLERGARAR